MRSSSENVRWWRFWKAVSTDTDIARRYRPSLEGTYSASVGEEVRANGLDIALGGCGEGTNRLEVLVGSPALGQ